MKNRLIPRKYYLSTNPNFWLTVTRVDAHLDELESILARDDKLRQERIEWTSYVPVTACGKTEKGGAKACKRGSLLENEIVAIRKPIRRVVAINEEAFYEVFQACAKTLRVVPAEHLDAYVEAKNDPSNWYKAPPPAQLKIDAKPAKLAKPAKPAHPSDDRRFISNLERDMLWEAMEQRKRETRIAFIEMEVQRKLKIAQPFLWEAFPDETERKQAGQQFENIIRREVLGAYR